MSTAADTRTAYRIQQTLRLLADAEQTAASYIKLIALARTLPGSMGYEVERLTCVGAEVEDGCEELRDQLLKLGYTPE